MRNYTGHYKALASLGVPIIIGQLGTIILGFADTLMIGHHSTSELAAAAFVNSIFMLGIIFSLGFSYGTTPIVGNLYGRGGTAKIGAEMKNAVLSNTVTAILICLAMTVFYFNLGNIGQPEELLPLIRPYFIVNLLSLPFVSWFNVMKQMYDGITDTRTPMWILIMGNVLNVTGNFLLIYGKLGLPEMGLLGAGIATFLSRVIMALVGFGIMFFHPRYAGYRRGFLAGRLNRADFIRQNRLGWPLAMQMGTETASFSLSGIMVGWLGANALAAHQVVLTVSQLFYMVYLGMAAAVSVRVSYFFGQGDYDSANRSAVAGFRMILCIAMCISLPVIFFHADIGRLFTDNEDVLRLMATCIAPLIIYQFGDGLQYTYANALRGTTNVRPLMFIAILAYFVISLPLGYLFGIRLGGGLAGIWYAFPFGLTSAGILYYVFFKRTLASQPPSNPPKGGKNQLNDTGMF